MPVQLPIFPLPNMVLFPRTHVPLHIFEPRYRAMIESVVKGNHHLGIANLREGYEKDYFGAPPVYRIFTSARVLFANRLDDGRWNILVEGVQRMELLEELETTPFRVVRARSLAEEVDEGLRDEVFDLMRAVATKAERIAEFLADGSRVLNNLENTHKHPAVVADLVASLLVTDSYARQSILEECNILRRLQLVNIQVEAVLAKVSRSRLMPEHPGSD